MTLRGSLTDMGIIDLIQFPHAGRKTGVLLIVSPDNDVKLFYREGRLVHAEMDDKKGLDVLAHLVDWQEGEFEFRPGEDKSQETSIEVDLHRAIMMALKARDEMKHMQEATGAMDDSGRLKNALGAAVKSQDLVEYAALLTDQGKTIAESDLDEEIFGSTSPFKEFAAELAKNTKRGRFRRCFLEGEQCTAVVSRLMEDLLLVIADAGANLGAVSISVNRINAELVDAKDAK